MVEGFDAIIVGVPELAAAARDYEALLGQPALHSVSGNEAVVRFVLGNTTLELRQVAAEQAVIEGLVLRDSSATRAARTVENPLGLQIETCDGSLMAELPQRNSVLRVDHLVLRSDNADACIAFFAQRMGIRLALDKTVPQWGGRMLFFRAGKLTLEVIESEQERVAGSHFWGIALQHPDIGALRSQLESRAVQCSAVREGRKPGTRVASVKSHCLGIPTLLIQPAD